MKWTDIPPVIVFLLVLLLVVLYPYPADAALSCSFKVVPIRDESGKIVDYRNEHVCEPIPSPSPSCGPRKCERRR